jgi:transcriptional regulator with GAF, ATPase, and Fis domain
MGVDENEFFRQATLRISSSLDAEKANKACLDYLQQHIPASGMCFSVYDPELNVARLLASIWPEELLKPGKILTLPEKYGALFRAEWGRGPEIIRTNDIVEEPEHIQELLSYIFPPDYSQMRMDLELEEEKLGMFWVFAQGKHRYTEAHAHLISLLHDPFAIAISNMLQHQEISRLKDLLADENRYLQQEMLQLTGDTIIGAKYGLRDVMCMVEQVAPQNSPVLLMGETGTGKEVIANAIHRASLRRSRPIIKVNCGAIPENLIDSELFGHDKGAFTGAISQKKGRFERAHNGTIFLDEIGELPLQAQVRLLRVLQQHEIERVGGSRAIPVDVRIISATHQNLEEMVRTGQFREDLWFRLNVFPIIIPPLRQRTVDISSLVNHFLERKGMDLKIRQLPSLAPGAIERLQKYDWPGNVRELENLVERALILNQMTPGNKLLTFKSLLASTTAPIPSEKSRFDADEDVIRPLDEITTGYIKKALDRANGRVEGESGAARMLGLHPSTLRGRMKKLNISYGRNDIAPKKLSDTALS